MSCLNLRGPIDSKAEAVLFRHQRFEMRLQLLNPARPATTLRIGVADIGRARARELAANSRHLSVHCPFALDQVVTAQRVVSGSSCVSASTRVSASA